MRHPDPEARGEDMNVAKLPKSRMSSSDIEGINALAARLRELLAKIGPEPWKAATRALGGGPLIPCGVMRTWIHATSSEHFEVVPNSETLRISVAEGMKAHEAEFVAEVRNALPTLLTALQSAKAALVEKEGELARAVSRKAHYKRFYLEAADRAERAEAELAAVRADAERYRWLREQFKLEQETRTWEEPLWTSNKRSTYERRQETWYHYELQDAWRFGTTLQDGPPAPTFDSMLDAAQSAKEGTK